MESTLDSTSSVAVATVLNADSESRAFRVAIFDNVYVSSIHLTILGIDFSWR